jgi:peptidoglycan hydrolase-like protein with peptidoglycan-binding domain
MRGFLSFFFVSCLAWSLAGATQPVPNKPVNKKPVTKKKAASSNTKGKVGTHAAPPGRTPTRPTTTKRGRKSALPSAPVERSQSAPTPERYREIQQALAAKGYLKVDPSGAWDADTQDAMRRFQADQKLDQTGKIDALSLISLGLGPKH